MAEISAFRGLRYDTSRVDVRDLVCPPYDVIAPAEGAALRARSPFNAIHLEAPVSPDGRPDDRYAAAAALLDDWSRQGVLRSDDEPALYLVEQTFTGPDGWEHSRHGFICRLRLEDIERRVVLPHEKTHRGPKEDRLKLLRATRANLSQIFMLYPDPHNVVGAALAAAPPPPAPPLEVADADGNVCRLQPITGPVVDRVAALLRDRQVLIADGHHRYETALAYRDERRAAGLRDAEHVMVYLSSMDDPGLAIFPTHRLLKGVPIPPVDAVLARLKRSFSVFPELCDSPDTCGPMMSHISRLTSAGKVFGLYFADERRCLTLELSDMAAMTHLTDRCVSPEYAQLSVTILAELVFRDALGLDPDGLEGHIDFAKSVDDAMRAMATGDYCLAAFLNATPMAEVRAVAERGETMPQKSTYFYPKLLTGLVFDRLD